MVAVIVGIENYRKPKSGDALPTVAYAHADAQAVSDTMLEIFKDMPECDVDIEVMTDSDASLAAIKDHLAWTIRNLSAEDLFIFYYAGHGFHCAGGNRLSTYDTNRFNIADTTLSMRDALLEPLAGSREGARFTFDLEKRRLEIAFGRKSALELVEAAQQFQLGVGRSSPMLAAPSRRSPSADDEA
ncbi:MAG: hypothetical protein EOS10_17665 [Mesorhizobium sp.]|nr:MAG: hypothetical protein EOS10_17665 [Mesorhizobium sp.]